MEISDNAQKSPSPSREIPRISRRWPCGSALLPFAAAMSTSSLRQACPRNTYTYITLPPPRGPSTFRAALGGGRHPAVAGEGDGEGGSLARRAVHLDVAAVALDDAVHDGEAEARALAHVLGGEEGVEDAGQDVRGDARAVVADRDPGPLGGGVPHDADGPSALAQGLGGVGQQVHQHLVDLAGQPQQARRRVDLFDHAD